jgi:hypothetical protein
MNIVVVELAYEHRGVSPLKSAGAVLFSIFVVSFIAAAIRPGLNTIAMLFVL